MPNTDFIRIGDFAWFLKVMMAMADIRPKELAQASGVQVSNIYDLRCGGHIPSKEVQDRLLAGIEKWSPGTIGMMRAAEEFRKEYWRHA